MISTCSRYHPALGRMSLWPMIMWVRVPTWGQVTWKVSAWNGSDAVYYF